MRVVPEINIMNGHCVKQFKGSYDYTEIVSHSPRKIARMWEEQGASYLHICDLDGVMMGQVTNHDAMKKLINEVTIPVEIYGGIYSLKEVENVLGLGASRVVLGLGSTNFSFLKEAVNSFGADKIAINIEGRYAASKCRPDEKFSFSHLIDQVKKIVGLGIRVLELEGIFQDISSSLQDLERLSDIMKEMKLNLMISGGVTTIKELELLCNAGISGVILDDALYERRIELRNAIELFDKGVNSDEL